MIEREREGEVVIVDMMKTHWKEIGVARIILGYVGLPNPMPTNHITRFSTSSHVYMFECTHEIWAPVEKN